MDGYRSVPGHSRWRGTDECLAAKRSVLAPVGFGRANPPSDSVEGAEIASEHNGGCRSRRAGLGGVPYSSNVRPGFSRAAHSPSRWLSVVSLSHVSGALGRLQSARRKWARLGERSRWARGSPPPPLVRIWRGSQPVQAGPTGALVTGVLGYRHWLCRTSMSPVHVR